MFHPAGGQGHPAALQSGSVAGHGHGHHLTENSVSGIPSDPYVQDSVARPARPSRQDSGDVSLGPYDSVSNAGDQSHHGVTSYGGNDWATQDPYARATRFSQVAQNQRLRSGSAGSEDYDYNASYSGAAHHYNGARESTSKLPLIHDDRASYAPDTYKRDQEQREYASDDEGSMIEGDTVVGQRSRDSKRRTLPQEDTERGYNYPPAPYDSFSGNSEKAENPFDDKEQGGFVATIRGQNKKRPNVWLRQFRDTTPVEQKIENHKQGIGVQNRPWACYVLILVCTIVFIVELVRSAQVTGKAIQTSPFNYMIGPSSEMLINLGARFTACMREVPEISNVPFACLNSTTTVCSLEDICGFGGFGSDGIPDQTFRFFVPIFLHVGVVHLILNMLVLYTSSGLVEKQMGTLRFIILYMICGIFGFVLGGNFALSGLASMGASGAIFGTHAAVLVDLIAHWRYIQRPKRMLFALIFEIVVGIALGYIPGIDNFSHIGGFAMGLLLSTVLLPAIYETRRRRITIYVIRSIAFVGACVMFGVLVNNFFTTDPNSACQWCRYLSCWPTNNNNQCKGTGLRMSSTTTSSSDPNTVGSQVNGGLALTYVITFFSGSMVLRSRAKA